MTAYDGHSDALCEAARLFGARGWCLATSGNFSARLDGGRCLITRSGCDKTRLTHADLMVCNLAGEPEHAVDRPSAETALHTCLYGLEPAIGAVLHTHSPAATVLSMQHENGLSLQGFEMQKAFAGVTTHEASLDVRIYANDQHMPALAARVAADWTGCGFQVPGFLIAGHGLYAWGRDVAEARRHIEGFEFLFDCLDRAANRDSR